VEAIKNVVELDLGAAFVSTAVVEKEVELGRLHLLRVAGVPLMRTLHCITDPTRYCSQAVRAFIQEMFGLTMETVPQGCFPSALGQVRRGCASPRCAVLCPGTCTSGSRDLCPWPRRTLPPQGRCLRSAGCSRWCYRRRSAWEAAVRIDAFARRVLRDGAPSLAA
jgi:LysR substrate binding domain